MSQKRFLEALILDFGGVLYPIDYDAPVRSFQALGFSNFESFYHKSNQHSWFDELEVGRMEPDVFLESLRGHCRKGTQLEEVVTAWNSILLRMPAGRVEAVQPWVLPAGFFCSATPTPFTQVNSNSAWRRIAS